MEKFLMQLKMWHDFDESMIELMQSLSSDLDQKNVSLKETRHAISEVMSEIQHKEMQKDDIIQKIERLKEEHAERKNCKLIIQQNSTSGGNNS